MPASTVRLVGVALALSGWMTLLFCGVTLGGAIHLLLAGALAAFPWRELRPIAPDDESSAASERSRPGPEEEKP